MARKEQMHAGYDGDPVPISNLLGASFCLSKAGSEIEGLKNPQKTKLDRNGEIRKKQRFPRGPRVSAFFVKNRPGLLK